MVFVTLNGGGGVERRDTNKVNSSVVAIARKTTLLNLTLSEKELKNPVYVEFRGLEKGDQAGSDDKCSVTS